MSPAGTRTSPPKPSRHRSPACGATMKSGRRNARWWPRKSAERTGEHQVPLTPELPHGSCREREEDRFGVDGVQEEGRREESEGKREMRGRPAHRRGSRRCGATRTGRAPSKANPNPHTAGPPGRAPPSLVDEMEWKEGRGFRCVCPVAPGDLRVHAPSQVGPVVQEARWLPADLPRISLRKVGRRRAPAPIKSNRDETSTDSTKAADLRARERFRHPKVGARLMATRSTKQMAAIRQTNPGSGRDSGRRLRGLTLARAASTV